MSRSKIVSNLVDRLLTKDAMAAEKKLDDLKSLKVQAVKNPSSENRENLIEAALDFPNFSHNAIKDLKSPRVLFDNTGSLKKIDYRSFDNISRILGGSRTKDTGQTTTEKSYYLLGPLAELEQALVNYTIDHLVLKEGFQLISVPDILHPEVIEACGLKTTGKITNVFKLDPRYYGSKALSGTSEMAFGSLFANKEIDFEEGNVAKFAAVSRCYRAESTGGRREKGLYRVHHFTKVEMFAFTTGGDPGYSDLVHQQFLSIQQRLFDDMELHYRVLDMHPGDLGSPASRKFDIEAILPGHELNDDKEPFFGEISSTSNCLDYQSRRLNIREKDKSRFCHTVNGTACAVPRMIMAICEQHQTGNGCVSCPRKLIPYMVHLENNVIVPRPKESRPNFQYRTSPKAFYD